jgi:hypothetical protein
VLFKLEYSNISQFSRENIAGVESAEDNSKHRRLSEAQTEEEIRLIMKIAVPKST